jgi:hypothetical protein
LSSSILSVSKVNLNLIDSVENFGYALRLLGSISCIGFVTFYLFLPPFLLILRLGLTLLADRLTGWYSGIAKQTNAGITPHGLDQEPVELPQEGLTVQEYPGLEDQEQGIGGDEGRRFQIEQLEYPIHAPPQQVFGQLFQVPHV